MPIPPLPEGVAIAAIVEFSIFPSYVCSTFHVNLFYCADFLDKNKERRREWPLHRFFFIWKDNQFS
jgi:hypothetical protein